MVDTIKFIPVDNCSLSIVKNSLKLDPLESEFIPIGSIVVKSNNGRSNNHRSIINEAELNTYLSNPTQQPIQYARFYLSQFTLLLDGNSRISLVLEQEATDLLKNPVHSLDILFREDQRRLEVRRIAYDAFGTFFCIDPTQLGKFRIRYSSIPPKDNFQERGLHQEAVDFHKQALDIKDASDGVKAFTGIITQIIAGDPKIIMIDEPEAFLHPALSYKLGNEVSKLAATSDKKLFVSTHSANFVMGCVQSGVEINIVRLTYQKGVATSRLLSNSKLLHLMRNPLLRSTGVLQGLFYESVIVTESDSDRAFYQEINERLLRFETGKGIPNCLFLNAQNKQTIHQIVRPLRELGIPAVGIVDVDILKDGGKTFVDFLNAGFIPQTLHGGLGQIRLTINNKCKDSGKDMKRDGGIQILDSDSKEAAENLFQQLGVYGLFVVLNGELEFWLKSLGPTGHGPSWLIDIFEKMGEDPQRENYVKPVDGDVWKFIEHINSWLKNPNRKGIPL